MIISPIISYNILNQSMYRPGFSNLKPRLLGDDATRKTFAAQKPGINGHHIEH